MVSYPIKLDVTPSRVAPVINLNQYDDDFEIVFSLFSSSGLLTMPSGTTAVISGTKTDGTVYSASGTVSGKTVTVAGDIQITAVSGDQLFELALVYGGATLHTVNFIIRVEESAVDPNAVPSSSELDGIIEQCQEYAEYAKGAAYGAPYVASTVAQMTDHDHVYVYTGSETGYVSGNWYYWNGSAWTSGGTYNSVAVATDKTLSVSNMAADAKVTGDKITDLKSDLDGVADYDVVGVNLFDKDTTEQKSNTYIAYNNGRLTSLTDWISVLIPVEGGKKISSLNLTGAHIAFFSVKNSGLSSMTVPTVLSGYISGTTGQLSEFSVPASAVQMSISFPASRLATVQVNYGTTKPYAAYTVSPAVIKNDTIEDSDIASYTALKNSNNGLQTFKTLGNFQHFGLNADGTFTTTQKYRVSNNDPMTFGRDLTINVAAGFRWGYIPFSGGTAGSWSGWKTSPTVITAGTSFIIQIARVTEDSSEIANVSEFVNAVTFDTDIQYQIHAAHPVIVEYDILSDGSGDFANLKACLESITDSSKGKQYVINIHAGEYDIGALYNDYSVSGLMIPNYVTLKGVGDKHNVILKAILNTQSTAFSLINMKDICGIENMTLISKNCRYTVHDDFQTARDTDCLREIKDVIFVGENCGYGSVYGSGLKGSAVWNFTNCEFDATKAAPNGTAGNAFSNHNNTNVTTPSFITFVNCRLLNGSDSYKTVRLLSMTTGSDNGTVSVTFDGCKIDGIYLGENDPSLYGAGINYWVNGFGNVNPDGVTISNTDGVDYSGNIDLI